MEPKTSLELILILSARHRDKQSIKKLLQYCGPEKFETYDKSLAAMSNEEVVQIVFKWIGCNSINGQSYDIRMRIAEFATTHSLRVVNRN